jgi:YesN/AraC family two-component response regulator
LILLVLTLFLYRLYRKKQAAYRDLAIRTQEWATTPVSISKTEIKTETEVKEKTDYDESVFESFVELVTNKNLYLNPDITLDAIAEQMGINRVYLSQAINRCYGDNFNNFINEFRIKEAVILLSNKKKEYLSIEGVAIDAGFNDRKTFYRVFKKFTGLSPSEFRENLIN